MCSWLCIFVSFFFGFYNQLNNLSIVQLSLKVVELPLNNYFTHDNCKKYDEGVKEANCVCCNMFVSGDCLGCIMRQKCSRPFMTLFSQKLLGMSFVIAKNIYYGNGPYFPSSFYKTMKQDSVNYIRVRLLHQWEQSSTIASHFLMLHT